MKLDFVKETTATEGTTDPYVLSGVAAAGHQTFYQCYVANGSPSVFAVPYVVTNGTDWECGWGLFNNADPGTLSRIKLHGSSNGGSAVSWPVGDKDIYIGVHSETPGLAAGGRNHVDVVGGPSAFDDETAGYVIGSLYMDASTGSVYVCIDPTTGSAAWAALLSGPSLMQNNGGVYNALNGQGQYSRDNLVGYFSHEWPFDSNNAQALAGTVHATAVMSAASPNSIGFTLSYDTGIAKGTIVAAVDTVDPMSMHTAIWEFTVAFKMDSGGTNEPVVFGTPTITAVQKDSAFSTTDVAISVDGGISFTPSNLPAAQTVWSVQANINLIYLAF